MSIVWFKNLKFICFYAFLFFLSSITTYAQMDNESRPDLPNVQNPYESQDTNTDPWGYSIPDYLQSKN